MKCRVCSTEIPEGKKCCPKCGRVITAADLQSAETTPEKRPSVTDSTIVYRPASSASVKHEDNTININNIFSSDPNAPVYSDPHTYDRATADVLEYDRKFMSKSKPDNDVKLFDEKTVITQKKPEFTVEQEYDYDSEEENYDEYIEEEEEMPARGSVIRDKKHNKPHFNLNFKFSIKYLILAIAVIAGLAVIIFGTQQLGRQFGIIGDDNEELQSIVSGDTAEKPTKKNEAKPDDDDEIVDDNSYTAQTGSYTVYSDQSNIFVYKSVTDQRIIATIPNKTIIEISEIKDDFGKTTYNNYTGWVKLDDLKFTPNEAPEKEPETTTSPEDASGEFIPDYKPGTYTVTLNDSSPALNVRSIGSSEGEIINTLPNGTTITVEEVKSSWGKVFVDGIEGWVYMEYLK